ncbi:MAG: branched-chain amino acid ABC transporter permease [Candidatus Euphemobacter frigidus]|nr:branched-chain amino acid ABC transporter permease [Candidatus Euphemobacter frigidus]MDP8275686.1 branched-chain amino acid ABC transporter permease [Candidatus Euphemobacter frigidus]
MIKSNYLALLILALVLAFIPLAISNVYYLGILIFVGINSLITIGLSLLMGYAGQISLGHAAFFGLGAYLSGVLSTRLAVPPVSALLLAALFTALVALLIGLPTLRLKGHYLAMATLGFGQIVYIVFNAWVEMTGGPSGFGNIPRLRIGGVVFDTDLKYFYLVWGLVVVGLFFAVNIIHSRVGRALRTMHTSEVAAGTLGINTVRYKIQIFVISAVYASVAGSLYAYFVTFLSPGTFGISFSILLVTMVVFGGRFSVWGALLGTAVLSILPESLRIIKDYDVLVYGAVLLLVMIFFPEGLVGLIGRVFRPRSLPEKLRT